VTGSVPGKHWRLSVGIVIGAVLMSIATPMYAALTVLVGEPFGRYGTMMPLGHTSIYLDRVCAGGPLHVRMGQAASSRGLCWPDITCKLFRDANHRLNPRDRDAKQLAISKTIGTCTSIRRASRMPPSRI
jgi:hypothetical protein